MGVKTKKNIIFIIYLRNFINSNNFIPNSICFDKKNKKTKIKGNKLKGTKKQSNTIWFHLALRKIKIINLKK